MICLQIRAALACCPPTMVPCVQSLKQQLRKYGMPTDGKKKVSW